MKQANRIKFVRIAALSALVALCSACSPDSQDQGSTRSKSLVVVDSGSVESAVAGGIAYVDLDENGELGAFEPFAITSIEGRTSSDVQRCSVEAPASDCLIVSSAADSYLVRILSGYDAVGGLPFVGQLATRVEAVNLPSLSGAVGNASATPVDAVTSLIAELSDQGAAELGAVLNPGDELQLTALLGALLGKVRVELEDSGDGEAVGSVLRDLTTEIAKELIGEGDSSNTPQAIENFVSNNSILDGMLNKVLQQAGNQKLLDGRVAEIAEIARRVLAAVGTIAVENPGAGRSRIVQMLIAKAARVEVLLAEINRDTDWFFNLPDEARVLYEALETGSYDLQALVDEPLQGEGAPLVELARVPQGTPTLENIGGQRISLSRSDEDEQIDLRLYFRPGANSGDLDVCLRYEDFNSDDGLETNGTLLRGNWSQVDPFTVVASLSVLGARESFTVRRIAEEQYRFNLNDEFVEYSGTVPIAEATIGELDSDACEQLLNSP